MKRLEGKRVQIWWVDPDCTWPYFTILKAMPRVGLLQLRGDPYPGGHLLYTGEDFWVNVDEIAMMQEMPDYVH